MFGLLENFSFSTIFIIVVLIVLICAIVNVVNNQRKDLEDLKEKSAKQIDREFLRTCIRDEIRESQVLLLKRLHAVLETSRGSVRRTSSGALIRVVDKEDVIEWVNQEIVAQQRETGDLDASDAEPDQQQDAVGAGDEQDDTQDAELVD